VKGKIGLIAGFGKLPLEFKKSALKKGYEVLTVGVEGITDFDCDYVIPFGKVGRLIKILEEEKTHSLVMLGKFEHRFALTDVFRFDVTGFQILSKAKDRKPETLIKTFMEYMEKRGFKFIDPKPFLENILADRGSMTRRKPDKKTLEEALWAFKIAKTIASMDVGQTIVVKDKAVVAVEAMEGTQETIKRGGSIAGKGCIVVKVARKNQDFRIDVPTVGEETLKVMKEVGAKALFLEEGKVFIVEKEDFLKRADELGICVYGIHSRE